MAETVISIENISKEYHLGVIGTGTFRGDLQRWWAKRRGLPDPHLKVGEKGHNSDGGTVWALKDVSFEVKQGEAVGIIGRNGAGKSTLLKILSRVTAPTSGEVRVKGRIASLLEVGTGFHPELTGRENIFMNAAILGMTRAEVNRKFDEIVDFSGVEKFIDTPVKRYSSGMYVRLAFAVAAHLEPEILIVDEVLAVGDAEFQKKCLGKMGDVASEGRTVLFVSHNIGAIRRLCPKTLYLDDGKKIFLGDTESAAEIYESSGIDQNDGFNGRFVRNIKKYPPVRDPWIQNIELQDKQGQPCVKYNYGDEMRIVFELQGQLAKEGMTLTWILLDPRGAAISWSNSSLTYGFHLSKGKMHATCILKNLPLAVGRYSITVSGGILNNNEPRDAWVNAAKFAVVSCDPYNTFNNHPHDAGAVLFDQEWINS